MPKVTIVGAGSAVFARRLITDVLAVDGLDHGEFALVDIDPVRLDLAHRLAQKLVEHSGKRWAVQSSIDRRDVLAGTDFLVIAIEVGGLANVMHEFEIPMKYGINQCIGDTIGPGGIFKALRTGPSILAILEDAEHLCPYAWVLNYTNPMSILTLTALRASTMRTVGLCHSIQGTAERLAGFLQVPADELEFRCAGLNHNAWYTELRWHGRDLYPLLKQRALADKVVFERDPVRFEFLMHFGAFSSESSGHFSEYVPYFRKRPDLVERFCSDPDYAAGRYARNWPLDRAENDQEIRAVLEGNGELTADRSSEFASTVIEAVTLGRPRVIYGNVANSGLIDNLGPGCVEVACLVDRNGIQPCHFGPLPEQLAALNRAHMAVHTLVSDALLHRNRDAARHALLLDPLSAAVCSLAELSALFDELWELEREYLQHFA